MFLLPDIEQKQASKLKDIIKRHQVSLHLLHHTSQSEACSDDRVLPVYLFYLLCSLQGSITDDKSKATHHIYPSPPQQDEGRVELRAC